MMSRKDEPLGKGQRVVREGECIGSIAAEYGFIWETLWNLPENRGLKEARKDPNVLRVGDRITIPERQRHTQSCATSQTHRFIRKGIPTKVRLRFLDGDEPWVNMPCLVSIEGKSFELKTDADGVLEFPVPSNARTGSVRIGQGDDYETYDLHLGRLDPADTIRGVQQRLANLGVYDSDPNGEIDDATGQAIHNFQDMYGLEVCDEIDELLIEKLIESNGS